MEAFVAARKAMPVGRLGGILQAQDASEEVHFSFHVLCLLHMCSGIVVLLLLSMQQLFAIIFGVVIIIIASHSLTWIVDVSEKIILSPSYFCFHLVICSYLKGVAYQCLNGKEFTQV